MSSNEHLRFYPNQIRLFFDPRIVFKKKLTNFFFFRSSFVSFRFDTSAGDVKETNGICSYFLRMANPILFLFLECPHPKRERVKFTFSSAQTHTHRLFPYSKCVSSAAEFGELCVVVCHAHLSEGSQHTAHCFDFSFFLF